MKLGACGVANRELQASRNWGWVNKCILVLVIVALAAFPSQAQEASMQEHTRDRSAFGDCLKSYASLVEKTEPSILDGARIIVDYLCRGQALAYIKHYDSGDFVAARDAINALMSVRATRLFEVESQK